MIYISKLSQRIFLLCGILMMFVSGLSAQELVRSTVGVSGASSEVNIGDKTYVVQQSVGQSSVIGTFQNGRYAMRQGFIQPPIQIGSLYNDSTINAIVHPNPFKSAITISFNEVLKKPLNIQVYDMLGRVIFSEERTPDRNVVLELDFLSTAQYVLHITSGEKQFKANILKN